MLPPAANRGFGPDSVSMISKPRTEFTLTGASYLLLLNSPTILKQSIDCPSTILPVGGCQTGIGTITEQAHGGGNKNGLQAFAWDFVFDSDKDGKGEEGQNIRAARGGRVVVVVESESKNSFKSTDLCKDGVGNYVVIDHGDGTFGTYWHLSKNGVIPRVGDSVNRGDKIAISGHTGVSSTPHLHFDVRTGWNFNYSKCNLAGTELPSVRVLLENKNHSCWIPRVGETLVSNNN